jgi:hypothetical protein
MAWDLVHTRGMKSPLKIEGVLFPLHGSAMIGDGICDKDAL